MFKIILKALLGTAVMTVGMGIIVYAMVAGFEYSAQVFGRHGPLVALGVICVAVIFSFFVSFFLYGAKLNAEEK